jgi:flavorubredoxin
MVGAPFAVADAADAEAVELVPGRLYALGAAIPLDGRVSWVPSGARGYQASNAHLLLDDRGALLYDTGVEAVGPAVLRQLEALLTPGSPLTIVVSRPELDCSGSMPELARLYRVSGAGAYDFSRVGVRPLRFESPSGRLEPGSAIQLGTDRRVLCVPAAIRMLMTRWLYDEATRTLFTADAFTHATASTPDGARVLRDPTPPAVEDVAASLAAKFWWLPYLKSSGVREAVERLFRAHPVEALAPSYGAVILGRAAVEAHVGAVVAAIRRFEAAR